MSFIATRLRELCMSTGYQFTRSFLLFFCFLSLFFCCVHCVVVFDGLPSISFAFEFSWFPCPFTFFVQRPSSHSLFLFLFQNCGTFFLSIFFGRFSVSLLQFFPSLTPLSFPSSFTYKIVDFFYYLFQVSSKWFRFSLCCLFFIYHTLSVRPACVIVNSSNY